MLSKSTNRAERTCPGCEKSVIEASMVKREYDGDSTPEEPIILRRHDHGTTLGAQTQILDSNDVVVRPRRPGTSRPGVADAARPAGGAPRQETMFRLHSTP